MLGMTVMGGSLTAFYPEWDEGSSKAVALFALRTDPSPRPQDIKCEIRWPLNY